MSELLGGEIFGRANVAYSSVWLNMLALFTLAVTRGIVNKPGSSTLLGAIAVTFKLVNTAPFYCHLLGIFLMGMSFDMVSTLLIKKDRKVSYSHSLVGGLSAYGGYALFALIITYVIRYEFWVAEGLSRVLHHIFVSGSVAAVVALGIVPFGYWCGLKTGTLDQVHPSLALRGALALSVFLWVLGQIVV